MVVLFSVWMSEKSFHNYCRRITPMFSALLTISWCKFPIFCLYVFLFLFIKKLSCVWCLCTVYKNHTVFLCLGELYVFAQVNKFAFRGRNLICLAYIHTYWINVGCVAVIDYNHNLLYIYAVTDGGGDTGELMIRCGPSKIQQKYITFSCMNWK